MTNFTLELQPSVEQVAKLTIPFTIFRNCEREEILSKVNSWIADMTNGTILSIRPIDEEKSTNNDEPRGFVFTVERDNYRVVANTLFYEDANEDEVIIGISKKTLGLEIVELPF